MILWGLLWFTDKMATSAKIMKPTNSCIARLILGSSIEPLTTSRVIQPLTPRDIDEVGLDQLTLTHDSTYNVSNTQIEQPWWFEYVLIKSYSGWLPGYPSGVKLCSLPLADCCLNLAIDMTMNEFKPITSWSLECMVWMHLFQKFCSFDMV